MKLTISAFCIILSLITLNAQYNDEKCNIVTQYKIEKNSLYLTLENYNSQDNHIELYLKAYQLDLVKKHIRRQQPIIYLNNEKYSGYITGLAKKMKHRSFRSSKDDTFHAGGNSVTITPAKKVNFVVNVLNGEVKSFNKSNKLELPIKSKARTINGS